LKPGSVLDSSQREQIDGKLSPTKRIANVCPWRRVGRRAARRRKGWPTQVRFIHLPRGRKQLACQLAAGRPEGQALRRGLARAGHESLEIRIIGNGGAFVPVLGQKMVPAIPEGAAYLVQAAPCPDPLIIQAVQHTGIWIGKGLVKIAGSAKGIAPVVGLQV